MRRVAEFEVELIDTKTRQLLQAYSDGINAYINRRKLPVEFVILGYKPEPWIIADTLSWIKMMAWTLSVNWEMEVLRTQLLNKIDKETLQKLEAPHPERWPLVVPKGTDYSNIGEISLKRAEDARPFSGPSPYQGLGSNNWVLSGKHTTTGKPILANDMHLLLSAPSIWYENHLSSEEFDIIGVTFPGIPGVISGHNGNVAWGFTNGFPDVQDLYIERIKQTDDEGVLVEYNGDWEKASVLKEVIEIKGGKSVVEKVIITRHGPVINSLSPDNIGEQPLALQWTALEPDTMIEGLFDMFTTKDCHEFHQSLKKWTVPVQNVVYADTAGNIAYTFPGKIPIRAQGDGRLPVPGWTNEYEWIGYVPFDTLPHIFNPPEGFIASANNRTFDEDYPAPITLEPINGDRAQRIVELISTEIYSNRKISINYIQKMHFDQQSPSAKLIASRIGKINLNQIKDGYNRAKVEPVVEKFRRWDGSLTVDSSLAAIYQTYIRNLIRVIISPILSTNHGIDGKNAQIDLISRYMGQGPTPVIQEFSVSGELWLSWLIHILSDPSNTNILNDLHYKPDQLMIEVLDKTILEMEKSLGSDHSNWSWGKLHQLTYEHNLGQSALLADLFNRGPYPVGGDQTTIWATTSNYHDLGSASMIGPPYRMIVDLNQLDNSVSILSPGQSGNPSSVHYDDQIDGWKKGGYHPMLYKREHIEKESIHRLRLIPVNKNE
jgi:penicillin amidase